MNRTIHRVSATVCLVLPFLVLVMAVGTQWAARYALDDSLMFLRYADHVLAGEGMVWNRGGEPVYGPTSLAYVGVVMLFRMFVGTPALAVQLTSLFCGVLFLVAASWLAYEHAGRCGVAPVVVTLTGLAVWSDSLAAHFTTGMDTTLAMAYLAAFLLATRMMKSERVGVGVWLTAVVGGAALAVRPELGLFTVLVPLSAVVFGSVEMAGRWRNVLIGTIGIYVLHAFLAWRLLGTPLPLSFYAKSVNGYGAGFAAEYGHVAFAEFIDFVSGYWLLIVPIAVDLCLFGSRWKGREMAVERGVMGATVLYLFYHLFMTLPIMPYKERFFHPVVPALIFLCAGAVARLPMRVEDALLGVRGRLPVVAMCLVIAVLSPTAVASAKALRKGIRSGEVGTFDLVFTYRTTSLTERWFALDHFSKLPDDLVIAATEIGLLVALNPNKRIVDMAGLNDRTFALEGFSADRLFERDPDLIYLPHPHYRAMNRALEADGRLYENYAVFGPDTIGTHFGIALRKRSPYYERMRAIVGSEKPEALGAGK